MKMKCLLDYELVATGQDREVNLLVNLEASAMEERERKPLNLGLVIDRSGSMQGEKMERTREAIKQVIRHLDARDRLSLVIFDNEVTTIREAIPVRDRAELLYQVDGIRARSMTNLSGGWLKGIEHVAAHAGSESINRIMLLTDGLANQGIIDPGALVAIGENALERHGIVTTTLGFGADFAEDLLTDIARASRGNFYYIESADMAPEIFREELGDLQQLIAQNIEITLRVRDDVNLVSQWSMHPSDRMADGVRYQLGDAYSGESKKLLVALSVPGYPDPGSVVIADAELRFSDLQGDVIQPRSITQEVTVDVTDASAARRAEPQADVVRELGMQISARARQRAIQEADRGDYARARDTLLVAVHKLGSLGISDPVLEEERQQLEAQAARVTEPRYRATRKEMSGDAHQIWLCKNEKLAHSRARRARQDPPIF